METPKFQDVPHMNEFVKPITLHAETESDIKRIKNHIIDNPGASVKEMAAALGIDRQNIRNATTRLNVNGHIRRRAPTEDDKTVRWEAGPDENYDNRVAEYGKPKQSIVSTWEPCTVTDPITDHLFGRVK